MNDPKSSKNMELHSNEVRFTSESGCLSMNDWEYKELKENIDIYLDYLERVPETISIVDMKQFFQSDYLRDPSHFNFHSLDDKTKSILSMIRISASYIRYLASIDFSILVATSKKDTIDTNDDYFFSTLFTRNDVNVLRELLRGSSHKAKKTENLNLTQHHIKIVFRQIVSIKNSFHLLVELFYLIIGSVEHLHFDENTFTRLNDSITKEDYEMFCFIIDSWNRDIVNELAIILETFYPTLLFVESITTPRTFYKISDDLRAKNVSYKYEFSFVGVVLIILINYILNNYIINHLDYFEKRELKSLYKWSFSFPENKYFYSLNPDQPTTCGIVNPIEWHYYMYWLNNGTEAIIELFNNNQENLLSDEFSSGMELENSGNEQREHKPNGITPNSDKHEDFDITCNEDQVPPIKKPKRHLSVGHSEETIKKLATYLVKGFTNSNGSLPALVSSSEGDPINQLVFLFTGNSEYAFEGTYQLTWNAEQVYLKLLVKLLYNLKELATPSNAIDTKKSDYISEEAIQCMFRGVWGKVAEAFTNIKSEASIRNAKYTNYEDTKAAINQKRQTDMKLIAAMWLKCKYNIDC